MFQNKRKDVFLLAILILLLFVVNYPMLDKALEEFLIEHETVKIDRVIDGDTVVAGNQSIRLLSINSPERGEKYYEEAKKLLENLVLNKTVELEFGKERYDKYKRILAHLFIDGKNINLKIVKEGLANFYFPKGKDVNYNNFKQAWNECIQSNKNLCEKSIDICANCIMLKEFDHQNQKVVFHNLCSFDCELTNWQVKHEGRKKFVFPDFVLYNNKDVKVIVGGGKDSKEELFWTDEEHVWTSTGDSLFLRDSDGRLVLWESY